MLELAVAHEVEGLKACCVSLIKEELTCSSALVASVGSISDGTSFLHEHIGTLSKEAIRLLKGNGIDVGTKEARPKKGGKGKKKKKSKAKTKGESDKSTPEKEKEKELDKDKDQNKEGK